MTLNTGLDPLSARYSIFSLNAVTILSLVASLIGVAKITFIVQSYNMKNAMYPPMLFTGKLPVRSVYMMPSFLSIYTMLANN